MEIQTANIHNFKIQCKQCGSEAASVMAGCDVGGGASWVQIYCHACGNKEEFDE